IVGKKEYIEKLKQHQLARVLHVDKFTLAGIEATLKSYIRGQETKEIPTVRDIVQHKEVDLEKAQRFINKISDEKRKYSFKIMEDIDKIDICTMNEMEIETDI